MAPHDIKIPNPAESQATDVGVQASAVGDIKYSLALIHGALAGAPEQIHTLVGLVKAGVLTPQQALGLFAADIEQLDRRDHAGPPSTENVRLVKSAPVGSAPAGIGNIQYALTLIHGALAGAPEQIHTLVGLVKAGVLTPQQALGLFAAGVEQLIGAIHAGPPSMENTELVESAPVGSALSGIGNIQYALTLIHGALAGAPEQIHSLVDAVHAGQLTPHQALGLFAEDIEPLIGAIHAGPPSMENTELVESAPVGSALSGIGNIQYALTLIHGALAGAPEQIHSLVDAVHAGQLTPHQALGVFAGGIEQLIGAIHAGPPPAPARELKSGLKVESLVDGNNGKITPPADLVAQTSKSSPLRKALRSSRRSTASGWTSICSIPSAI